MDAVGPMAASVLEPGEEPFNPNFFSLKAFTTASYRDKPATCRSSSLQSSDRAPHRPGESDPVDAEGQRLRPRRSSSSDSPDNAPLTNQTGEQGESSRLPASSSFSALLSLAGPCSPPFSPTQRLINTLSPLGFFGRGRAPEDEGGDKTVCASADCGDSTYQDNVNSTRRSILTSSGEAQQRQTSPLSRLFFFSSTPASTSSVGSESLPGSTCPGVGQEPVPPLCLVVCIHGLAGAESDFRYMAERLKESSPLVRVLLSTANTGKTFDGVRKGGERLAEEVRRDVRRHPSLRYICFIGFSLGGLYMRYAVRLLYTPPSGDAPATVCGLIPLCIGTVASPHLGVRRFSYVPLPEGFVRPLISSYLRLTSRLRGKRKGSRGLVKKSSDSLSSSSSGRILTGETVASPTSLAFEAGTDAEEGQGGRSERYPVSGREEETRRSDGCVSPSAAQQAYAQAAAEFIAGGEPEVLAQAENEEAEEESTCGPNLGRLSQLYESTTLADLMLLSASEQKRELEMQGEKTGGTPFWFWGRSQSHNETDAVAEHETEEQNGEESQEGSVEKEEDDDDEPLLVKMSKGVFVESLQAFKHRRLYANARGDILVPLGTAAIEPALPSNPQLQLLLQQARRSMIAGSGRIVMIVQPDGTPMPIVSDSASSPMPSVPSFWGSAPATVTQEASPFFSCQSSFATDFPCTSEATLPITPDAQLAQSGLSPEQSATLENSGSMDFPLSPDSSTWRESGSPSALYETSSVSDVSTKEHPTAASLQQRNACDFVGGSQLSHPSSMLRKDVVVLPAAVGGREGNVCESMMNLSVEQSTQSDSIQDVSHTNEKSQTSSVFTVSSSVSAADPSVASLCSDDGTKEKPTIIQACEVSASTTTSRSTGSSVQESFLERRLLSTSSLAGWTDWLKLNTYGDVEAAMANRLNEVRWTKFIVDFPNLIPVAHDSINASGKSRFRTWVTSAGRPIVEQMVDWFIYSLHEALQQDLMPREASGRASGV